MRARQISAADINRLEDMWKENIDADFQDLNNLDRQDDVVPAVLRYEDGYQYQVRLDTFLMSVERCLMLRLFFHNRIFLDPW